MAPQLLEYAILYNSITLPLCVNPLFFVFLRTGCPAVVFFLEIININITTMKQKSESLFWTFFSLFCIVFSFPCYHSSIAWLVFFLVRVVELQQKRTRLVFFFLKFSFLCLVSSMRSHNPLLLQKNDVS